MSTTTNTPMTREAGEGQAFSDRIAEIVGNNARAERTPYTSTGRDRRRRDGTDWSVRVTGPDHRSYHTVDPAVAAQIVSLLEQADQAVT